MENQNVTRSVQTHSQKEVSCTVLNRHTRMCTCSLHIHIYIHTLTDETSQSIQKTFSESSLYTENNSKSLSLAFKVLHNWLQLLSLTLFSTLSSLAPMLKLIQNSTVYSACRDRYAP